MILAHQALGHSAIWGCDDLATVSPRTINYQLDLDHNHVDLWYIARPRIVCSQISHNNLWHLDAAHCPSLGALYVPAPAKDWARHLDRVVSSLGRLKDDWAGPSSLAPSQAILVDLETVLRVLPSNTKEPEVDVDPSDGSVTVRWWSADEKTAFAMSFLGNASVYGITTCAIGISPSAWHFAVSEETKILDAIETRVGSVIAGQ
jgi:hypothetical protein